MEIIARTSRSPYVGPDGTVIQEIVSPDNSRAEKHSLALVEVPPGVRVAPHRHHESEEVYHLRQGSGLMYLDGTVRKLGKGDTVVIRPGEVHSIKNESEESLVMIVTCVPAWRAEDQVFVEIDF